MIVGLAAGSEAGGRCLQVFWTFGPCQGLKGRGAGRLPAAHRFCSPATRSPVHL